MLRIKAPPNFGKSVLSSAIIDRIQRDETSCVLYCYPHRDPEPTSSTNLVRLLLAQTLQWKDPQIIAELDKVSSNHPVFNEHNGKCEEELWRLLQLFMASESRKIYIIVDALDECAQPLSCLQSLIKITTKLASTVKPNLFVSLRLEGRDLFNGRTIQKFLDKGKIKSSQIEITQGHTSQDVIEFVAHRVAFHSSFSAKSQKIRDKIIKGVCERASGMFLYANLALDDLRGDRISSISAIDATLAKLPEGLYNIYKRNLAVPTHAINGSEAFCWIFSANPALSWNELQSALAIGESGFDESGLVDDSCEAFIQNSCGNLVESFGTSEYLRFIHPTVKDFLLERLTTDGWCCSGPSKCPLNGCLQALNIP